MPETVLQGPNGQPAVDNTTGQPLTMEEMLRRRGIVADGGYHMMPMQQAPASSPTVAGGNAASPSLADAVAARGRVAPTVAAAQAPTSIDAMSASDPAATVVSVPEPSNSEGVNLLGVAGAGAAGALGTHLLHKYMRGRGKSPINQPDFGVGKGSELQDAVVARKATRVGPVDGHIAAGSLPPIDAEFTEVPNTVQKVLQNKNVQRLLGRMGR